MTPSRSAPGFPVQISIERPPAQPESKLLGAILNFGETNKQGVSAKRRQATGSYDPQVPAPVKKSCLPSFVETEDEKLRELRIATDEAAGEACTPGWSSKPWAPKPPPENPQPLYTLLRVPPAMRRPRVYTGSAKHARARTHAHTHTHTPMGLGHRRRACNLHNTPLLQGRMEALRPL